MKRDLKPLAATMLTVLHDPRASRVEKIEAAKVLLSCHGCLIPDIDEKWLSIRQLTALRQIKQQVLDAVLKKKQRRKKQNRRAYLRRQIETLEERTKAA